MGDREECLPISFEASIDLLMQLRTAIGVALHARWLRNVARGADRPAASPSAFRSRSFIPSSRRPTRSGHDAPSLCQTDIEGWLLLDGFGH